MSLVETGFSLSIPISGMSCASCAGRVEKALAQVPGVKSVAVNLATNRAHLDSDQFVPAKKIQDAVESAGYGVIVEELTLRIKGMSCASCVSHVEDFLLRVPGVIEVQVNLALETARVKRFAGVADLSALTGAVELAGYEVVQDPGNSENSVGKSSQANEASEENRRLILAILLTAPLVLPMLAQLIGRHWMLPGMFQLVFATPVQFYAGAKFYRGAWRAIQAKTGNMDLLVALGTSAAFGLSVYNLILGLPSSGHMELYFESSAVIITLVLVGKFLEGRAKAQTAAAIRALQALSPDVAIVRKGGHEVEIPIAQLKVGDILVVKPGERIPADAMVVEGASEVDESLLTGESLPVEKQIGNYVIGGAVNGGGLLVLETKAVGAESTLARVIRLVENAQAAKAPIQKLVDRVSGIFVPVVLGLALLTIMGWYLLFGNFSSALMNGVAVLVIACPCALGLATPTSILVGTGLAAKFGILIKDAEALEIAHSVTLVAFDKTGTLTEGRPEVSALRAWSGNENELLARAAALQMGSEHPLARAVIVLAESRGLVAEAMQNLRAVPGRGIEGVLKGEKFALGSERWMKELGLSLADSSEWGREQSEQGATISYLANLDRRALIGGVSFSDKIKSKAISAIGSLKRAGIKTLMLTGDNRASAMRIASQLGIAEVQAEILPEEKAAAVLALKARGEIVAMVGDGINDAPALASADIGIAMSTGSDVAMHTAAITLMRGDPSLIAHALTISRLTVRKIRQNLFWAFAYNIVGIPLAALGMLSPGIAGAAMAFSSVSVVTNALLLRNWRPEVDEKSAGGIAS